MFLATVQFVTENYSHITEGDDILTTLMLSLLRSKYSPNTLKPGQDNSVGITTRYALKPGIESIPIQWVPGFFPGGKPAGAWR